MVLFQFKSNQIKTKLKSEPKVLGPLRKVAVSPLLQIQKRSNFAIQFIGTS
jgi:hypothetical protein